MTLPRFTAEASLYGTRGQYRNGVPVNTVPTNMIGPIYPARDEVIEIHSCPPGYNDWGGTCYPILTEPPIGGSGDPGAPGESGEGGEPRSGGKPGGGGKPPKDKPKKPPRFNPTEGGTCYADEMRGDKNVFVPNGKYTRLPGDIWFCCDQQSPRECIQCQPEGGPITRCADGWPL